MCGVEFCILGDACSLPFKHGAIRGNMQEIYKEKANFRMKRIIKFPGLTCHLLLFLPFFSRTRVYSPVMSGIIADPKTLWPIKWGKHAEGCVCG